MSYNLGAIVLVISNYLANYYLSCTPLGLITIMEELENQWKYSVINSEKEDALKLQVLKNLQYTKKCTFSLLFLLVEVQQYQSKGALHVSLLKFFLILTVVSSLPKS